MGVAIGRLFNVNPNTQDRYYFRFLLNYARSSKGFEDIFRVDGIIHENARDVCYALGLLDDNN